MENKMFAKFTPIAKQLRKSASADYLKCQNHIMEIIKKKKHCFGDEFDFAKLGIKRYKVIGSAFLGLLNEKSIRKTGKFKTSNVSRQHGRAIFEYELL